MHICPRKQAQGPQNISGMALGLGRGAAAAGTQFHTLRQQPPGNTLSVPNATSQLAGRPGSTLPLLPKQVGKAINVSCENPQDSEQLDCVLCLH